MQPDDAYQHALDNVPRNPDGSFDRKLLLDLIAEAIDFDEDTARHAAARRVEQKHTRPGASPVTGQLQFPTGENWGYEPNRLVFNDERSTAVEQARATPPYTQAEARRARRNAQAVTGWADRKQVSADAHTRWAMDEMSAGRRTMDQCTYDSFVRDTGLLADTPDAVAEQAPETDPEEF